MAKYRIDKFTRIARALADPGRVRAMLALEDNELCVCQVVELLGLAPSTVSKHMTLLKQAGLVESRKDGRWIYYRTASGQVPERVKQALEWVSSCCSNTREATEDQENLEKILSIAPESLCRLQSSRQSPSMGQKKLAIRSGERQEPHV